MRRGCLGSWFQTQGCRLYGRGPVDLVDRNPAARSCTDETTIGSFFALIQSILTAAWLTKASSIVWLLARVSLRMPWGKSGGSLGHLRFHWGGQDPAEHKSNRNGDEKQDHFPTASAERRDGGTRAKTRDAPANAKEG